MFTKIVGDYLEMLNSIEKSWDATKEAIVEAEEKIQDLLHEIELTKFDVQRGYRLAKQVQDVRQKRRKLKNKLEILTPLKEYHDRNQKQKIDLFKVMARMKEKEKTQQARTYKLRADNPRLAVIEHCEALG